MVQISSPVNFIEPVFIGSGSYGHVYKVKDKRTGLIFARKQ